MCKSKTINLWLITAIALLIVAQSSRNLSAEITMEKKFSLFLSAGARQAALNETSQPWALSPTFSGALGIGLSEEIALFAEFEYSKLYNDSASTSTFKLGKDNANQYWKMGILKLKIKYNLIGNSRLMPYITGALGLSSWSVHDRFTGEKIEVTDGGGNPADFSAAEMIISGGVGGEWFVSDHFSFCLDAQFNYLTGVGADFSEATNKIRSRGYFDIKLGIAFYFNLEKGMATFSYDISDQDEEAKLSEEKIDTDMDGVPNLIDLCPDTPPAAYGKIDEYGCPSDTDGDGIPDYIDKCPYSFAAITVDSTGCPPDQDEDNVPDETDICPGTPRGYPVDDGGCPIYEQIFTKIVMQPEFSESGQRIDFRSIQILDSLAVKLRDFPEMKISIKAYSDNSLSDRESMAQNEREAEKIKSLLVSRRISGERIEAVGMGATNFIDTNTTASGRDNNHRIEIEFIY